MICNLELYLIPLENFPINDSGIIKNNNNLNQNSIIIIVVIIAVLLVVTILLFGVYFYRKIRRNTAHKTLPEELYWPWNNLDNKNLWQDNGSYAKRILLPKDKDYLTVTDIFCNALDGAAYKISSISVIYNPILLASFCNSKFFQEDRIKSDPSNFSSTSWKDQNNQLRQAVYTNYQTKIVQYSWNNAPNLVPIIYAVHGTDATKAERISISGFASSVLNQRDSGWYGKGVYLSTHAVYCFPYVATRKFPVMIISYVLPGNVYPVIENASSSGKLLGSGIMSGYQSHYICTKPDGTPPHTMDELKIAIYDEIVIQQEAQILPVFVVHLSSHNFNNLAEKWQRSMLSIEEISEIIHSDDE